MDTNNQRKELVPGVPVPPGMVLPDYYGGGTANLTQSILRHFGAANPEESGLRPELLPPALFKGVNTVVMIIVDGLGYIQLQEQIAAGNVPNLAAAAQRGSFQPITTTAPSMTACALTTLHTGATPAQHGMVGWNIYFPEAGRVYDMLKYSPVDLSEHELPIAPNHFTPVPTIYERLRALGISVGMVNSYFFKGSGFSGVLYAGVEDYYTTYAMLSDLMVNLRHTVEQADGPTFLTSYWAGFDTVSHQYGGRSAQATAEIAGFDFMLGRELIEAAQRERDDTLVIITADHGQIDLGRKRSIRINGAPWLEMLHVPPAGDRRTVYLHAKPGYAEILRRQMQQLYGEVATVLSRAQFIASGLLGNEPLLEHHLPRVGDVVLLLHDDWELRYDHNDNQKKANFVGVHGGLSALEMYATCLAFRL